MEEKNLNFDEVIDRRNTNCLKFDFAERRGKPADVLPLWVADMDFKTSSLVLDALTERVQHGIFGYTESRESYFEAVSKWMEAHHDWKVERSWLTKTPGVVFALAMAVKAYSKTGDAVLIQQPVYYQFSEVIRDNNRKLVRSGAVYAKKTINGITYHTFTASAKNAKMTDIEKLLEESGYTNVCLTKDFFYATFDPDNAAKNMSCIAGLTSKAAKLQANDDYDISDFQFFMNTSVTMKSKIKTTNGKLSNKSKAVKWTIKDASKKKNLYASTAKTTKTAKTTAVKNNKSYKAGKKITVSNSKSLVKMKLDGKAVKKNTVVKKKGTHTLTIWSKNGKVQNVTFTIK